MAKKKKFDIDSITIRDGVKELSIFVENDEAWVSSRTLAEMFGKEHFHVIRDIEERILPNISRDFGESNFGLSSYKTKQNKNAPEYILNRKAFSLVAMGFTGSKAMKFKEMYVEAFEAMYAHITTRKLSKEGYKKMCEAIYNNPENSKEYWIEADLLNRTVLGMTAKQFREVNDVEEATRDVIVSEKLATLDAAQTFNANLIECGLPYDARKILIQKRFGE